MIAKICILILFFNSAIVNVIEIRNLYEIAADNEAANSKLNALLKDVKASDALLSGYKGAAIMMEANHVFNPITKLSRFKKGKQVLENAIRLDPTHIELRYIRLTIQTNVPGFLGYSNAIQGDKKNIIGALDQLQDRDLRKRIVSYLLEAKICNTQRN